MIQILIVDDEKIIRERLENILILDDYKVFTTETGAKGLAICQKEKIQIALVDLRMSDMDGIEVLREIKEKSKLTEVIIITGHGEIKTAIEALKEGAFRYIRKPVDYDELSIHIKAALEKQEQQKKMDAYVRNLEKAINEKNEELKLRKEAEDELLKLNECFIKFGTDIQNNINTIVKTAGKLLKGKCAFYNKLTGNSRYITVSWNAPEDMSGKMETAGGPCFEVISSNKDFPLITKNLSTSPYAETCPYIKKHNLKTYIGHVIRSRNTPIGVICVLYQQDKAFRQSEIKIISILAKVLEIEEERKYAMENFNQSQKMEVVGRLVGGVVHDFNNLLMAIDGYSDFLMKSLPIKSENYSDVNEIKKTVESAKTLTRQLLIFSRKDISISKIVDLNDVLINMKKMLNRVIGENFELSFISDPELKNVKVNPGHIEQIIMNLVINARDAMPNGGKIVIESRNIKIKEHDNNVDSMPRGHYAQITITDTGIGINAETQAHIFEPFFTSKPLDKGTGMGLFTVNEIINKMNGRIFIRSEVNIGTVVTFYIPINAPIKSLPIKETKQACGATILLVEDNEALRRVMSRILRQDNYEILEAANGEAANTLFEQNKKSIRLIITDIVMPKLGGLELAKHLKSAYPDIRIIFTSGYDNNVTRNQTDFEFGDAFLQKPVTQIELLKHVKQSLNSAKKTDKTGL